MRNGVSRHPIHSRSGIDLLDSTKIIPEELAPVEIIGTMQLNANPTTQLWEADLLKWEFYATELNEWYKRLQNILTA